MSSLFTPAVLQRPNKISTGPILDMDAVEALKERSFPLWVTNSNIVVDNNPISFFDHKYLIPIYKDESPYIVIMKAAQMGATVWLQLRLLWHCTYKPIKASMYFPTKDSVEKMTKDRLNPLIYSNPSLCKLIDPRQDAVGLKRLVNGSSLYMNYLGGHVSKDSTPFDVIAIDEVRLVDPKDVDQVFERLSHSRHKIRYLASTAGYPGTDIDLRFGKTDQHFFHTKCGCPDGIRLAHEFPNCVAERSDGRIYLECPKCKTIIKDPQEGRFIPWKKDNSIRGYHIHQLLSKFITLEDIWLSYKTTTNIKEFYNAKLGLPYVEEDDYGVKDEDLAKCVRTDINWEDKDGDLGMGVDQMKGLNVVVIAKRYGNKKRIVHLEWIEEDNPFPRLYQLMAEYNIKLCVLDAMPNANEALQFAKSFPNKVYLAYYHENVKDMVKWEDKRTPKIKKNKKYNTPDTRFQYKALIQRYQSLDWTYQQFQRGLVEIPDPRKPISDVTNSETGKKEKTLLCEQVYFSHLKCQVREREVSDEKTHEYKIRWVDTKGIDPHFAHATNYCFLCVEKIRPQFRYEFF